MAELGNGLKGPVTLAASPNDLMTLDIADLNYAAIQITGTWAGTVAFTASIDGTTFVALLMTPSNSATQASSATANGAFAVLVGGYRILRAQWTVQTSGSPVVTLSAS
jgi:hypothetical protein